MITPKAFRNGVLIALAIVIAFILALAVAGRAHADESSYLTRLHTVMSPTGPSATWIDLGHIVCGALSSGTPNDEIAGWIVSNTGSGIYFREANKIIDAATSELCPSQSHGRFKA